MPSTPAKPCRRIGCTELTDNGLCPQHLAAQRATYDREKRPERHKLYSTIAWKNLREWHIARHPVCEQCKQIGRMTLATIVHHRQPIETHPELALTASNLESICDSCHSALHASTSFQSQPLTTGTNTMNLQIHKAVEQYTQATLNYVTDSTTHEITYSLAKQVNGIDRVATVVVSRHTRQQIGRRHHPPYL